MYRYLPFANGTPSHDQLGLIFGALDAAAFQTCFIARTHALNGAISGVITIDGSEADQKTIRRIVFPPNTRRSFDRAAGKGAIHMVSAWSSRQKLVLGAQAVDEKSNEITAIPGLLDLLAIEGAIVTIDAPRGIAAHNSGFLARHARWGCQKKIAARIINRQADYVFGLKGNQGSLRDDDCRIRKKNAPANFTTVKRATHGRAAKSTRQGQHEIQVPHRRMRRELPSQNPRKPMNATHSIPLFDQPILLDSGHGSVPTLW